MSVTQKNEYNLLLSIVELYYAVNLFKLFKSVIPDILSYYEFGYLCYTYWQNYLFIIIYYNFLLNILNLYLSEAELEIPNNLNTQLWSGFVTFLISALPSN